MSEVVNVKWLTVDASYPEWVELTLANGQKIRYYAQ